MLARRAALGIALATLAACAAPRSALDASPKANGLPSSNVTRADYAGSAACLPCHREIAERWQRSPMHRMTRDADRTEISAPFDGSVFRFMDDNATMLQREGRRYMRVESSRYGDRLYRVTKVIGGRYREDFVGTRVATEESFATPIGAEEVLPVSWLRFAHAWRYKGYSVMTPERDGLRAGPVWRTTCIFCHNTAPGLTTLYDELFGAGAPKYQGSASFVLPAARAPRFEVTDESGLAAAVRDELLRFDVHASDDDVSKTLERAIVATRRHFDEKDLVELGIGCEACHGGSREHARDPNRVRPSFALKSSFARVLDARGRTPSHAEDVNRTCAKCHTVLFTRYPYTWEGRSRNPDPGGSHITSGEARDFMLGGCATEMSCAACHDPHVEDPRDKLEALAGASGDALCAGCHAKYASAAASLRHSHHPAGTSGSHCIECHMPRKNMGLGYALTRYHRIGSPTERARVEGDRPLECALCHVDRSIESLVAKMEAWWGKRYDRAALRRLYGDLGENALKATLERGKPHERAVAIAVAGERHLAPLLSLVVTDLADPYPLVRFYAKDAIERIEGEPVPVDAHEPGEALVRDVRAFIEARRTPDEQATRSLAHLEYRAGVKSVVVRVLPLVLPVLLFAGAARAEEAGVEANGHPYHVHDGFYLRLDAGFGAYSLSYDNDVAGKGGALALDLLIGGSPIPGLSLGGAWLGEYIPKVTLKQSGTELGSAEAGTVLTGFFVDAFPDPNGGFHFGGMLGAATIQTFAKSDSGAAAFVGAGNRTDTGYGGAAWVGYDAWIADEWCLGGMLRATAASAHSKSHNDTVDSRSEALMLVFTMLYHLGG